VAILATFQFAAAQTGSVLRSGLFYKMAVDKEAVYKISYDQVRNMGFDLSKIDPRKIRIFGNKGGMLPQANGSARPFDLQEIAIRVEGESDGKFDRSDFILFYGEGPDKSELDIKRQIFRYENNLYADRNFYFFTVSTDQGKRMDVAPDLGNGTEVHSFNDFVYHELDEYNDQKSGREWFGEIFGVNTTELTLSFPVSGIVNNSPVKLVSSVMGQSFTASSFSISLNGFTVGTQTLASIPNSRYGVKGIIRRDTFLIDASASGVTSTSTQALKYSFTRGTGTSKAFLNYALLNFERSLELYNNQTVFQSLSSLSNAVSKFAVGNASGVRTILDITDHYNVKEQSFTLASQQAVFSTETTSLKKFVVCNSTFETPAFIGAVPNQDLHDSASPDLLIITHPSLRSEAERLATHRFAFSRWEVKVVAAEEVYNEFSSGRQDVSALRDFVRHLWSKAPLQLKAVLFFGKSSYDYKDRIANNKNLVATYESRNSLHPLQTYSSDDFFGFLEENEGEWSEDPAINHTLDIGVGRLPATTLEEAKAIVDKIIDYDLNRRRFGAWRKQIVFVADDGNGDDGFTSLHQSQADQLSQFIDQENPGIDVKKLFMGSFTKVIRPSGESIPTLRDDLIRAFDRGSLIINYTGHGNEDQWGDEAVFTGEDILALENEQYPFLVTATCEFGRHDDPQNISSAEKTITHAAGGSIGLVTTARPVNATTNFNLNRAFYDALLTRQNNLYLPLGEVFRRTKNNSVSGVSNRNFSLLADPSMTLALPSNEVHMNSVKTATGSDTLKALSTVIAKGEIRNPQGEKITSFNGVVEATLFDKETDFVTSGRNNPPFQYKQWYNALFRGKAKVKNGEFELTFMLPKNIAYQVAKGKLSLYALHDTVYQEAAGAYSDFKVGETELDVVAETAPPSIRLFIGDSTFVNGGVTTPDTWFVANLKDNSGINISAFGIGNSIIGVLDNDVRTFILNDYYIANTNDPTSGWVNFPLKNLEPGRHRITITVWDIFNNSAEASVEFIVTDGEALVVESFGNFPNPFMEKTTLFFTHNRSGDDLQAQLFIYDRSGLVVKSFEIFLPESEYQVNIMEFDPTLDMDKKLSSGLYLARLVLRSLSNGSKNEQVTKLILLN
jgi:hypothetical protein